MRTFWPGNAGLDSVHVEFERVTEECVRLTIMAPESLFLGVGFNDLDVVSVPARELEIPNCLAVNREDGAGRPELGRHVGQRCTISKRQGAQAVAVELDELADHTFLAKHFCHSQYQVGRGGSFLERAREFEANDVRNQHRNRLTKHGGFCFDAANTPTQHAERIDHGRVTVRADDGVGVSASNAVAVCVKDDATQILKIDLMNDTGVRWYDTKVLECRLAPTQE